LPSLISTMLQSSFPFLFCLNSYEKWLLFDTWHFLQVKKENAEREALGALPLYQRTLP
jgi:hypothetical protein